MKTKNIAIVTVALLMLSNAAALATVKAPAWPYLPGIPVHLTAINGIESYFISTLSGVPAGFDVQNGVYPGWCIDPAKYMPRSVSLDVMLYSSLSPPVLSSINWVAINYILNHKQGSMMAVQDAIWHFTIGFAPSNVDALAMIALANANPSYDPMTGAVLAVLCIQQDSRWQNSIIELPITPPPPSGQGLSPGYWKHNVNVYNGGHGSYSGDPHITPEQLEDYAAYIAANFHSGFTLAEAQHIFQNNDHKNMWLTTANWFNAAAGLLPYAGD